MKFLIDMNLSPRWVAVFEGAGIEAAHWSTVGPNDAPDAEILEFAGANDYVVLTHDLDFGMILAITQSKKPSVVQIRSGNVRPDSIARQVIVAVGQMAPELDNGALLTVDPGRGRLRVLPLRPRD